MPTHSHRNGLFAAAAAVIALCAAGAGAQQTKPLPPTPGPFKPDWDSLRQYKCPEWFRDAKFGIWAHWTAQCVPEQGDWYARSMYEEGSDDNKFHVARYGHPSKFGFKDIDNLWHAENWDPAELIALYKAAGAKYFVALANHHDNFDAWNSKYQPWNSVRLGPHKDIIGTWAKIARANGLRFGVTVHAARAWDWFDVSHGSDKSGPMAGVPYDGNLTLADGKGKWWEGYDPAELYGPAGAARTPEAFHNYETKFYNRVTDLLTSYHPDLLYFDDGEPPTSYGLQIASNYYNMNRSRHNGKLEAVLNVKNGSKQVKESMVLDYERGRSDKIAPNPWQTDTCIGDWHYRRSLYENHQYKTAKQVVRMLVDIVSKNGNLLLNVPLRGDGSIDDDEFTFLHGMAAWMSVNSEAIYSTRPWTIPGEGPVKIKGGGFSEGGEDRLTAEDFRFTTKGKTLYAVSMGWPASGRYIIRTLAANAPGIKGDVTGVRLLGSKSKLTWKRDESGLVVKLPDRKPCDYAWTLKIQGIDVAGSSPAPAVAAPVAPSADGTITLKADDVELHGDQIQVQSGPYTNIGYWDKPGEYVTWRVRFDQPGAYAVSVKASAAAGATSFALTVGTEEPVTVQVPKTDTWDDYRDLAAGIVKVSRPGEYVVSVKPADIGNWRPMNLAFVTMKRSGGRIIRREEIRKVSDSYVNSPFVCYKYRERAS